MPPLDWPWVGGLFLAAALFLLLAWFLRRFAGPVFAFDVVRTARRSRSALLRGLYAGLLLLVLFVVYTRWFDLHPSEGLAGIMEERFIPGNDQARFATTFFHTFLAVQFLSMLVLTPTLTAGAISEEREKGTLGELLTTQLSSTEIILGKLLSRLGHLVLLLLTGLPVLALLQLLGGVDPPLLAAVTVLTFCSMVSMASLCMLVSVRANRTREAVLKALIALFAFQGVMGFCCGSCAVSLSTLTGDTPLAEILSSGSIFWSYQVLEEHSTRGTLGSHLPVLIHEYVLFHAVVSLVCLRQAVRGLRAMPTLREETAEQMIDPLARARIILRKPLKDSSPLVWKEVHVEPGSLEQLGGRELNQMLTVFGVCYGVTFLLAGLIALTERQAGIIEEIGFLLAGVFLPLFATLGLLRLALRAASCLSSERERQTLDSLLTTPLTNEEILQGKWLGCMGNVRGLGLVIVCYTLIGAILGYIPVAGGLLVLVGLGVQAALVVCLGMACSLGSRSTFRATVVTVVGLLALTCGHWLLYLFEAAAVQVFGRTDLLPWLAELHTYGLTPPLTLGTLATCGHMKSSSGEVAWGHLLAAGVGTALHAALVLLLWGWLYYRFPRVTGRAA
jgi:ABC-type transport system involved in multi-copper enzyme maturation permease subunit